MRKAGGAIDVQAWRVASGPGRRAGAFLSPPHPLGVGNACGWSGPALHGSKAVERASNAAKQ
jgi:hypothetical protein